MYYTTNIKTLTTETWNKIREHVSIYELNLPASNKLVVPEGKEDIWVSTKKRNGSYYYDEDKLYIVEVTKCWTNPKNTIKVVIFGKRDNAYVTVLSRRHPVRGFKNLRVDRYSGENQDVFDNIKVGSWLVCLNKSYNTNGLGDPAFLMNSTLDEVKEAIEGAVEIDKIRSRAGSYVDWRERDYVVPNNGTVHLSDVKATILRCKRAVRRFLWIARKRKWDLKNAVKDKLKMTYNNRFKVVAKGLDGNIWHLDAPLEPNLKIRERFSGYDSIYKLDFWLPFVYQPKYRGSNSKTETFITMLLSTCKGLPEDSFTIGMNKKRIHFERKETSGGAILNSIPYSGI